MKTRQSPVPLLAAAVVLSWLFLCPHPAVAECDGDVCTRAQHGWRLTVTAPRHWRINEERSYPSVWYWMLRRDPPGRIILSAEKLDEQISVRQYAQRTAELLEEIGFRVRKPQLHAQTGAYWFDFENGSAYLRQALLVEGGLGFSLTLSAPDLRSRGQHLRAFDFALRNLRLVRAAGSAQVAPADDSAAPVPEPDSSANAPADATRPGAQSRTVPMFASVEEAGKRLRQTGYVADTAVATTVYLASQLGKPILTEGPAGVGKTELAKAMAEALEAPLVRLQCYEGLDEAKTLYEWKYAKQLLYTQLLQDQIGDVVRDAADLRQAVDRIAEHEDVFFSERFLQPRPLLQAISAEEASVLLIDEVDRAEEELEAFFLEVLAEFQVTIPEIGPVRASHRPLVVLTSNNTRELSDALRRRCLHLWMDYPTPERETEIIRTRVPGVAESLAEAISRFVADLRSLDLKKAPSISESIDWARALVLLSAEQLGQQVVQDTLNVLLKYDGDLKTARAKLPELLK